MIMEKNVLNVFFLYVRSLQKPVCCHFVFFFCLAFFILNANGTQETSTCVETGERK